MARRDIIVIGASAGGVEALTALVSALPADLPASVFVTLHLPAHGFSVLPQILDRAGALPALHATHGEKIVPGRIYVAPPDRHLLVLRDEVGVVLGPRENGHRPAIDPLFRSAATNYGERVIAVVLSGTQDDGTAGTIAVRALGGVGVAQDPEDAIYSSMPQNAIELGGAGHVAPAAELGSLLVALTQEESYDAGETDVAHELDTEVEIAAFNMEAVEEERAGKVSAFTCPECHGALWELHEPSGLVRYRCRVGHAYSAESLLADQDDSLEEALWMALRALEERAALIRRMAERARGRPITASQFEQDAQETERRARLIREALTGAGRHENHKTRKQP